jgi:hypothetical protein
MDKPLCKLCNRKHYSHEGHKLPDTPRAHESMVKDEVKPQAIKSSFDRVAYQREYMRKRRADKIK